MLENPSEEIVKDAFAFLKQELGRKSAQHIVDGQKSYLYQTFMARFEYLVEKPDFLKNVKAWAGRIASEAHHDLHADSIIWRSPPLAKRLPVSGTRKYAYMEVFFRAAFVSRGKQVKPNFGSQLNRDNYPIMLYPILHEAKKTG